MNDQGSGFSNFERLSEQLHTVTEELRQLERAPQNDAARDLLSLLDLEVERWRRRRLVFGPSPFGDPARDMLLELGRARLTGRRISVSAACRASDAPITTGLRYLSKLASQGLVERRQDDEDARRVFVVFADLGQDMLAKSFGQLASH